MQHTVKAKLIYESPQERAAVNAALDEMCLRFNNAERGLYRDIRHLVGRGVPYPLPAENQNAIKSHFQIKYNINARFYNAVKIGLDGKIDSVLTVADEKLLVTEYRITKATNDLKYYQHVLKEHKNQVLKNEKLIRKYQRKLHYINQRLQRLSSRREKLTETINNQDPHLCFGSKALFMAQFKPGMDFVKWKEDWLFQRNRQFTMVGAKCESQGNQICQITSLKDSRYQLQINPCFNQANREKPFHVQIEVHHDRNNYLKNLPQDDEDRRIAITYRFMKQAITGDYEVHLSFETTRYQPAKITCDTHGAIGVDMNADHLAICNIDAAGNLLHAFNLPYQLKGMTSEQRASVLGDVVKALTDYAQAEKKNIVIEDLDFSKKKSNLKPGVGKAYNEMISSFAYKKMRTLIQSRCFDKGLSFITVDPAYTSVIGRIKYHARFRLTSHQSASLVIARRGFFQQNRTGGFLEKPIRPQCSTKNAASLLTLPVGNGIVEGCMKSRKQNDAYWRELNEQIKAATPEYWAKTYHLAGTVQ